MSVQMSAKYCSLTCATTDSFKSGSFVLLLSMLLKLWRGSCLLMFFYYVSVDVLVALVDTQL